MLDDKPRRYEVGDIIDANGYKVRVVKVETTATGDPCVLSVEVLEQSKSFDGWSPDQLADRVKEMVGAAVKFAPSRAVRNIVDLRNRQAAVSRPPNRKERRAAASRKRRANPTEHFKP